MMAQVLEMQPKRFSDSRWAPLNKKIQHWERAVESIQGITRITLDNQNYFSSLLMPEDDADSYLTSPAYYAFTGRRGLWLYQEGGAFIPFCWHPNVSGQILVFPVRGASNFSALYNLLTRLPEPPSGMRLARLKRNSDLYPPRGMSFSCADSSIILVPVNERVLDWKFPLRVLSTKLVSEMDGSSFRYIRNHVKHIKLCGAEAVRLNAVPEVMLDRFIVDWAKQQAVNGTKASELISLYRKVFSFVSDPNFSADGFAVLIMGKVEALNLWDVSNMTVPSANRFANLCSSNYRGLADYATQQMAECLYANGIQYVNIGGAETDSLDCFKRKFMPAYSIDLHSAEVVIQHVRGLGLEPVQRVESRLMSA